MAEQAPVVSPSDMLGKELTVTTNRATRTGVCDAIRDGHSVIETERGRFRSVQFRIAGKWTCSMPDYTHPVLSQQEPHKP